MADHDILKGSVAWERLQQGIPGEITNPGTRRMFHDYAVIITVLVNAINELLDEQARLHERINRRRDVHDTFKDRLLDPEEGLLKKNRDYTDSKTGRMTALLLTVLGGVVTASIMLAASLASGGS